MKKSILLLAVLVLTIIQSKGQCLTGTFSVSDTICPGKPLTINNSASTAVSYNWDICLGDLDSVPTSTTLPQVSGTLAYPQNMKVIKVSNNYYAFVANVGSSYVTRFDFGSSLNNTPSVVNLTGDVSLSTLQTGIDIAQEGNKWMIFVTQFSGNTLVRLDLDSITQITPTFTTFNLSGLNNPYSIKLIDHYGFIQNNQSAELIRLDFGGSYLNAPTVISPNVSTLAFNNLGIDIAFDCTSSKYIGFGSSYGYGTIYKIDFGNSLSNTPTVTNVVTSVLGTQGLQLIHELNKWYLFATNTSNTISAYTLGNSLDNIPSLLYTTSLGGSLSDPKNIQLIKEGSEWIGLIPNTSAFTVSRINFPQACINSSVNTSSTDQSPSNLVFSASALGYQLIELDETFADGSTTQYIDSVYVNIPPPVAQFSNSAACENTKINFIDQSSICFGSITSWQWDFGDSFTSTDQNPEHTYSTGGTYNVQLIVTSDGGITSNYQYPVTVHENPVAGISGPNEICAGVTAQFTDNSTSNDGNITQWLWTFSNGGIDTTNNASTSFTLPGNYTITLVSSTINGCKDTAIATINNLPGPIANFNTFNSCVGETATFINLTDSNSTIVTDYKWIFGDGNNSNGVDATNNYPATTALYNVTLIANAINGCNDTLQKTVHIGEKPKPWFTIDVDTICQFANINLTDSSFAATGEIISKRTWLFSDGTIVGDSITLTHAFASTGHFTISLTVSSPTSCDSTISRDIFVIGSPNVAFTATNSCWGIASSYTDLSTSPLGSTITNWAWDFGDTTYSTLQNETHQYILPGNYQVTLIVGSNLGCYDTLTQTLSVYENFMASFGYSKACSNQPIQFTDSSTSSAGQISTWEWDFSTGVSISQNPIYSFPSNFAYGVTLVATTQYGCSDTITKYIIVNKTPEFTITSPDHCIGNTIQLQYNPATGSSPNNVFFWDFGDNTASFQSNPSHLYSTEGDYLVNLQVTNPGNSCFANQFDTVHVYTRPTASFTESETCEGKQLHLTDVSTIASGNITSWAWTFQGNGTSTNQNPSITYNNAGNYSVGLTAISNHGCSAAVNRTIEIFETPIANFTPSITFGAPPLQVSLANTSDSGNYTWNFGDQTYSNLEAPTHVYSDTGRFDITLTVTTIHGCIDSTKNSVYSIIPIRDLAITGASFFKQNDQWVMKAIVVNRGNEDAESYEIKAQLDEKSLLYQTFTDQPIKVGQTKEITFNSSFEATSETPGFFCSEVISINGFADTITENNRHCITTTKEFEIFTVYPNPFNDEIYLAINAPSQTKIKVTLFNSLGDICLEAKEYQLPKGYSTISYPVNKLNSALYLLKVNYGDEKKTFRLMKD